MMKEIQLSATEQMIYEELMLVINSKQKETVSTIAKRVGVAPSTIIKVTKKLGYPGWNEMYYSLNNLNRNAIPLSLNSFDFINQSELNEKIELLSKTFMHFKDSTILIKTIGDSQYISDYLLDCLWQRGFEAYPYNSRIMDMCEREKKNGIIVLINESGIALLDISVRARKTGFKVIAITNNHNSPLATNSHLSIEIMNHKSSLLKYEPNFFTARVLIFIELLLVSLDDRK